MKITIITVCRNAASLLPSTILSVLEQTYHDVEYIVIDGASTDGTQEIIRSYADRLAYWVSEPDKGIYDAMNKGLAHATGSWVNFMNAGDRFVDDHVLQDLFGAGDYPSSVKVVAGHTRNCFADHQEVLQASSADYLSQGLPFSHQATFTRIGGEMPWRFDTSYRFAADYNLFHGIYCREGAMAFKVVDRLVADYRQEDSSSMSNLSRVKGEYLKIRSVSKDLRWWKEWLKWKLGRC